MTSQLLGTNFIDNKGQEYTDSILANKNVLLYFSASWCGPCRSFSPSLAEFYNKYHENKNFEIVFVSSDQDAESFNEYFGHMPWKALPFSDRQRKQDLSKKFKVQGIPTLVVLDQNGKLITDAGVENVMSDPSAEEFPWTPLGFADSFGSTFLDHAGKQVAIDDSVEAVGIYFSAHWCPPCRGFTPKLAETYNTINQSSKKFEVVFVSGDNNEEQFNEYFESMPWLAIPLGDKRINSLNQLFKVQGIPHLVIVDPKNGQVINDNGRSAVSGDPNGEKFPWHPLDLEELTGDTAGAHFNSDVCFAAFNIDESVVQQVADKYAKGFNEQGLAYSERPLFFLIVKDDPVIPRVKEFLGIGDKADGPFAVIFSLSDGAKYEKSGDLTFETLDTFVGQYLNNELTPQDI